MKILIVIEKSRTGFAAYAPDVQGCVATGRTKKQVERAMQQAIEFHLSGMREDGMEVPPLRSTSAYVEVPA